MDKISTILVPFDFSETAQKALGYVAEFTGRNDDIQIVLAHISKDGNFKTPQERIEELEEKYHAVLKNKLEWVTREGTLTEALLDIRKTKEIDLVIMGTHGTHREETNTSKLVMAAECPVLVIPVDYKDFQLKRIALVLGKEEIDEPGDLGILLEVARRFNAKVHVVTIANEPGSYGYSKEDEKNENTIAYYLENFYADRVFIKNTDIVDGILSYASKKNMDLIAILPRNHTRHSDPSEGQLTQLLTLESKIPVLAID